MTDSNLITRRGIIAAAGAAGIAIAAGAVAQEAGEETKKCPIAFDNASFYKNGKFDVEAGKDAYIALMKFHGYPVFDDVREKLWVSDYGIGEFTKLGLGANMFMNDEKERFMVMDLFLLPNQMLPEHYHLPTDKGKSKMEGWVIRHGLSYVYGEGEPTKDMKANIPESQKQWTTVFHEVVCGPGMCAKLNRPTARHWQFAGPQGAIMTESATYHDDAGVRHSNPNLVFPT